MRTLKLSRESMQDLTPAELTDVVAGTSDTITFDSGPRCHPSLRLQCSIVDCIRTV